MNRVFPVLMLVLGFVAGTSVGIALSNSNLIVDLNNNHVGGAHGTGGTSLGGVSSVGIDGSVLDMFTI